MVPIVLWQKIEREKKEGKESLEKKKSDGGCSEREDKRDREERKARGRGRENKEMRGDLYWLGFRSKRRVHIRSTVQVTVLWGHNPSLHHL